MVSRLERIYQTLYAHFGPQGWWPADSRFEMIAGAILTQNTSWKGVEKAIAALKAEGLMDPLTMAGTDPGKIQRLIRPAGFFRQKTERLLNISRVIGRWHGDLDGFFRKPMPEARKELLSLKGLGPETADSILLYAGNKPVFVVDAYSKRICSRLGLIKTDDYDTLKDFFERNVRRDVSVYQEFHALLIALGKNYCLSQSGKARCATCPLEAQCEADLLS